MSAEKRALQIAVSLACLVPLGGGGAGLLFGPGIVGGAGPFAVDLDSHVRYLSGLLLAIGLGFLTAVPGIERQRGRFQLLGALVVTGGLGRLLGVILRGPPSAPMLAALVMELGVTPALVLWQHRLGRKMLQA